jgi:hypothetical protein
MKRRQPVCACRHLPDDVRVFSVQRVSKSFDCRSMCINRAYHYYVPASVLGLRAPSAPEEAAKAEAGSLPPSMSADDLAHNQQVLLRLRQALSCFVGDRPFHNYTKRCGASPALHDGICLQCLCCTTAVPPALLSRSHMHQPCSWTAEVYSVARSNSRASRSTRPLVS